MDIRSLPRNALYISKYKSFILPCNNVNISQGILLKIVNHFAGLDAFDL